MPKQNSAQLVELILSLTKAEKRHFKLMRTSAGLDTLYVRIFDFIDKTGDFNEEKFLKKNPDAKKSQLSNLKAFLYKQLLADLRALYANKDIDIEIREQLDFARVLFNKGLYAQSLDIIKTAKKKAERFGKDIKHFELLYTEKLIEQHFVTSSTSERAWQLTKEAKKNLTLLNSVNAFSGLALKLYALYSERGYIKNEEEASDLEAFFYENMPEYDPENLSFNEKLYLFRAYIWFYYINQNFLQCYRYAQKLMNLFEEDPDIIKARTVDYCLNFNFMLSALYRLNYLPKYKEQLELFNSWVQEAEGLFNPNLDLMTFKTKVTHGINYKFMTGDFEGGKQLVAQIEPQMKELNHLLENRFIINTYYKFASIYFGNADYKNCVQYLNRIIYLESNNMRKDIHAFARILLLVTYYEMKDEEMLAYQIKSTYHYFSRIKDLNRFQREIIKFLRKLNNIYPFQLENEFKTLRDKMIDISKDPYESRAFLYFDIISWLESKIKNVPISALIREKGLGHRELFN